jgi:glycosyltransferase involved in cell wall biosynthesis
MRIAYLAPLIESVPPRAYGGTERVIHWLCEEMIDRGHDVTLFASGDSRTRARLVAGAPRSLRAAGVLDSLPLTLSMVVEAFAQAERFDLIHSHVDWPALPFSTLFDVPVIHTLHGRLDLPHLPAIYARHPEPMLVSISNAQRAPLPEGRFVATVYHGMPADLLRPSFGSREDYVLFLGRISREKGPVTAMRAARAAGLRLVIAAKVDPMDQPYFESEVRAEIAATGAEFVGEVTDDQKAALLGRARALLAPIEWPEPFGLVFIESLACGTPVITRPLGSAPEIVEHGRTGLIADTVEGLARAILDVERIDPRVCRASFEQRFTVERMARDYEAVYRGAIEARSTSARGV